MVLEDGRGGRRSGAPSKRTRARAMSAVGAAAGGRVPANASDAHHAGDDDDDDDDFVRTIVVTRAPASAKRQQQQQQPHKQQQQQQLARAGATVSGDPFAFDTDGDHSTGELTASASSSQLEQPPPPPQQQQQQQQQQQPRATVSASASQDSASRASSVSQSGAVPRVVALADLGQRLFASRSVSARSSASASASAKHASAASPASEASAPAPTRPAPAPAPALRTYRKRGAASRDAASAGAASPAAFVLADAVGERPLASRARVLTSLDMAHAMGIEGGRLVRSLSGAMDAATSQLVLDDVEFAVEGLAPSCTMRVRRSSVQSLVSRCAATSVQFAMRAHGVTPRVYALMQRPDVDNDVLLDMLRVAFMCSRADPSSEQEHLAAALPSVLACLEPGRLVSDGHAIAASIVGDDASDSGSEFDESSAGYLDRYTYGAQAPSAAAPTTRPSRKRQQVANDEPAAESQPAPLRQPQRLPSTRQMVWQLLAVIANTEDGRRAMVRHRAPTAMHAALQCLVQPLDELLRRERDAKVQGRVLRRTSRLLRVLSKALLACELAVVDTDCQKEFSACGLVGTALSLARVLAASGVDSTSRGARCTNMLLSTLRVLVNLTNNSSTAARTSFLRAPVPPSDAFDVQLLVCGALTNLVESDAALANAVLNADVDGTEGHGLELLARSFSELTSAAGEASDAAASASQTRHAGGGREALERAVAGAYFALLLGVIASTSADAHERVRCALPSRELDSLRAVLEAFLRVHGLSGLLPPAAMQNFQAVINQLAHSAAA